MSYLTMAMLTGGAAVLGLVFTALVFKLDEMVEQELQLTEQERRWTSVI